jgi:hypothetical protein
MISALLFDKTPADVRLDAPIDTAVHIPLNHVRAVFRLLSLVVMAGGSVFAIVTVALHFNDATSVTKIKSVDEALGSTMIAMRILQLIIAAATLAFGVFAALRAVALLQSREAGLTVGPRGITLACELRDPNGRQIPWRSIAAIELRKRKGIPAVVLRLCTPDDPLRDNRWFSRWFGSRVTITPRSLRVGHVDLKILLDRYFAHYAVPPSSKEAS